MYVGTYLIMNREKTITLRGAHGEGRCHVI